MKKEEPKLKGLSKCRFRSIIFLFRLGGVPFKIKEISPIYAFYIVTVIICASTTHIGMCVNAYIHRDDLGRSMTTVRMLIPFTNIMWLFLYCG